MAVQLMQIFSQCKEDFKPLAETLGLYFQIRDDYFNLCVKEVSKFMKKEVCENCSVFM